MLWSYAVPWLALGMALVSLGLFDLIVQWVEDNTNCRIIFYAKWAAGGFLITLFTVITCEIIGANIPAETRWAFAFIGLFVGLLIADDRVDLLES